MPSARPTTVATSSGAGAWPVERPVPLGDQGRGGLRAQPLEHQVGDVLAAAERQPGVRRAVGARGQHQQHGGPGRRPEPAPPGRRGRAGRASARPRRRRPAARRRRPGRRAGGAAGPPGRPCAARRRRTRSGRCRASPGRAPARAAAPGRPARARDGRPPRSRPYGVGAGPRSSRSAQTSRHAAYVASAASGVASPRATGTPAATRSVTSSPTSRDLPGAGLGLHHHHLATAGGGRLPEPAQPVQLLLPSDHRGQHVGRSRPAAPGGPPGEGAGRGPAGRGP